MRRDVVKRGNSWQGRAFWRRSQTHAEAALRPPEAATVRPSVRGKFIYLGDEKLYVRGVTYGAFAPDANGAEYHDRSVIESDFAQMSANGLNAVRIPHTVPPVSLLDAAERHGLRVVVGLSAEQHAGFLTDKKGAPDIEEVVREKVRACAKHPAILCYALGNEIPASTVRWLGRRRVELYLKELYRAVKQEDPDGLVTYVNYPSTEYLQLPFLDLVAFNVYLESRERLEAYLARLQNISGDRPLLMTELGLDSLRNGQEAQAGVLDWQIRTTFASGCAGAFLFSWTDEWHRAGEQVEDWAFGITDQQRRPKPALASAREAFADVPVSAPKPASPRVSVVVCTHNGSGTIDECLEGLLKLDYPNYEIIVVDDGSTDGTAAKALAHGVEVITIENSGLGNARNVGLQAAIGEIVAFIDDDAYPDPHWLRYLVSTFMSTAHAAVGGPNIAPDGDGAIAESIAHAPGGPIHVLLTDREAEHIPGCNMAFRASALKTIGNFDPQFRVAGDDVDICWRLQERGFTVGFSPAAVVWHHRRKSIRAYWRQQRSYGKAEALLERKWPLKYNALGNVRWSGRVYGNGFALALARRAGRIYHGMWGMAPFQSIYQPAQGPLASLATMPEWYLAIAALAGLSALGVFWTPLLLALPLTVLAILVPLREAVASAARVSFRGRSRPAQLGLRTLAMLLNLLQPLARLVGHLRYGLTPWRRRCGIGIAFPRRRSLAIWSERGCPRHERLHSIEEAVRAEGVLVVQGGDHDRWDLELRNGLLGAARLLMDVEDHGARAQLVRVRVWSRWSRGWMVLVGVVTGLFIGAALEGAWQANLALGPVAFVLTLAALRDCGASLAAALHVLEQRRHEAGEVLVQPLQQRVAVFARGSGRA